MSQYRGYYTSATKNDNPPPSSQQQSSIPYFVSSDDDFEYDQSYMNHNKRPFSQTETCGESKQYNSSGLNKHQKVNHYYSSSNTVTSSVVSSSSCGGGGGFQYQQMQPASTQHASHLTSSSIKSQSSYVPSSSIMPPPYQSSSTISPELAMPVFQTADRRNEWDRVRPCMVRAGDDAITVRSGKREEWAWGTGNKWVGAAGPRPRLNVYSGAPKIEMFTSAARVTGGIGEKMLQKMGWREGEGLGKSKEGAIEPVQFSEIKTDRKGLISQEDESSTNISTETIQEKTKSKFSELKSTSFWNWHGTGMRGPENVNARLKNCKKAAKEKSPPKLDLSGKHPVSALVELCSKKKWKEPKFTGEVSKTGFRFKVEVNGSCFTPSTSCDTKKSAKAESARNCLVEMGWQL